MVGVEAAQVRADRRRPSESSAGPPSGGSGLTHRDRPAHPDGGLRERKKRLMRQQLSDVATAMFLDRGFDGVRVAEIAAACGVSEKTVFNYFPTKESLLLDREEAMGTALRDALLSETPPVGAMLGLLEFEIDAITAYAESQPDPQTALTTVRRFADLIEDSTSLRAHQRDMMERLVVVAAEALAARCGLEPEDPEPQAAASSLLGLWRLQFRAMKRYADGAHTPRELRQAVGRDVARAARLLETGLDSLERWSRDGHRPN